MSRPAFLNALNLPESVKDQLASLGTDSPLAILCMRQASPEAFDAFIGEPVEQAANALLLSLSVEERLFLETPYAPAPYATGAQLDAPPKLG